MKTIVILRCGDVRCALDRVAVSEVTPLPALARPPSLPATIEGVMNLAGQAVLVVSLGKLMGVPDDPSGDPLYHHVVVLGGSAAGVGLLVDRVEDIRQIAESSPVRMTTGSSVNDCVIGEIESMGEVIHLLDAHRILLDVERVRLADIRRAEQARLDALQAAT